MRDVTGEQLHHARSSKAASAELGRLPVGGGGSVGGSAGMSVSIQVSMSGRPADVKSGVQER